MKKLIKAGTVLFAAFLICTVLVFTSGIAVAIPVASSELMMNNFQFTFTPISTGAYIDWGPPTYMGWQRSWSEAANNPGGPGHFPAPPPLTLPDGWVSSKTVGSGDEMALAFTNNTTAYALAKAKGMSSEYAGEAWFGGFFHVSGLGKVQVTVDYEWNYDLQTDNPGEEAFVFTWAELALQNGWTGSGWTNTQGGNAGAFKDLQFVGGGSDNSNTVSGSFTYDWYYFDDEGSFQVLAYSYAKTTAEPIPEPGTILLLGSGLVGLAGFRRRFKK